MSAQDTLALVLEASDGQTGTHYHRCYLDHAPCLAQLLIDQGNAPLTWSIPAEQLSNESLVAAIRNAPMVIVDSPAAGIRVSQDALAYILELAAEAKIDRTAEAWARSLRETNDSPERAAQLRDLAEQIGITL